MAKPAYERPASSSTPSPSKRLSKNEEKMTPSLSYSPGPCPYVPGYSKEICILEYPDHEDSIENIAVKYLTLTLEFPREFPKTRRFYEKILEETGSASVTHKMRDTNNIGFSTLHINRILKMEDWIKDVQKPVFFHDNSMVPKTYNYFDYIKAWEGVLNYQNQQKSHSWFISPEVTQMWTVADIPSWFYGWFYHYGITAAQFSPELLAVFCTFRAKFSKYPEAHSLVCFALIYNIPWILCWELGTEKFIGLDVVKLYRQYKIKWWNKFEISRILDDFDEYVNEPPSSSNSKKTEEERTQSRSTRIYK